MARERRRQQGRRGQARDPRDRADVWNGERAGEDPERGIPAVPLNAAPPQQDAEAGKAGQHEQREQAGQAEDLPPVLWDLLPGHAEWQDAKAQEAMIKNAPYSWWIQHTETYRFAEQIELHYGIFEEDGHWCRMPSPTDRIHRPPPGYIGVYTRQLQYGLRFPLDPFVRDILIKYRISLCQLTPVSIRRVMTYLWVCRFFAVEPNLHCFRKTHQLVQNLQSVYGQHGSSGWWRIESRPQYLTMWPNDSSDKDWRGQWVWVRVPADPEHPYFFGAPRYLSRPDPSMQDLGPEDPDATSHPSYEQMNFFGK